MYNSKYFKSNINSYKNVNKGDFNDDELPPEATVMVHTIALIDSVF